ncbi:alpha/beta hydrolase fold domain-containing protein [Conexibacter sp. DBS9H8]|uniref:alpha/beta hydrolase fold domain-containing protein n=1 Tax=Conexibacter sp. DBS9H8 TaxID=2937801 RepID=UPI00200F6535|nr:alpha/beta hydrolase fold domain-containing protein [Conexibacter sp. DBS9H8]
MPTVSNRVLIGALRLTRRNRIWVDGAAAERYVADRALHPVAYGPPRRLGTDVEVSAERWRGWPLYRLTPRRHRPAGVVVYTHGGGWVSEIVSQHWRLCAEIAEAAATTVLVPIYPLIPFGTAAEVVPQVAALAAAHAGAGPVCLAGDSAGGQIALSAALELRDRHQRTAARTILISPALDATLSHPRIPEVEATDPWLGQPGIRVVREYWRGELALDDPLVSPLWGELAGLGPITVFTGTRDLLSPDAARLHERALAAGVRVDYHERPGLVHVYPLTPVAEARAAREVIRAQVRAAVRAGAGPAA